MQYHPDKATGPDKALIESIYVNMQLARDTLSDPAKRFAYDRFGPEILEWRGCKEIVDYVMHGVQALAVFYAASGSGLVLLGVLGYLREGKFWRYLVMAALFVVELYTITRPGFPGFLTGFINPILIATGVRTPYLPFQLLAFLRKLSVTFFIAVQQLGPILQSPTAPQDGDGISVQQLTQLEILAKTADQEMTRLMGLELTPFVGAGAGGGENAKMRDLRATLKEWLVHNTIRNDPEVKTAIQQVLSRRRHGGGVLQASDDQVAQ